uniref:CCR4-NOT transcription complex subunit 3 n=1 Tax=Trichogramma kaykai TaxID=54128 RepID=A0ABD2VUH9_9HYME
MAATRKLQGEIDRCLKKVSEGVETFEDIWQKVHNATNSNQKEKYEADLKKEIKKLQRLRDQIKSWIASGEIKDKSTLLEYRKLIETQMERFKVVERETKTKAYSKEGLGAAQKLDPAQKEREEVSNWLSNSIDALNLQLDTFESEIESLLAGKKKKLDKDKQDRMDDLKAKLDKHRYHIRKLETLLRMLDNMSVEVDTIKKIKDDVEYYIESSQEPDFEENEYIYDDIIGLDEIELSGVTIPSSATTDSNNSNDTGGTPTSTNSCTSPIPSPSLSSTMHNHSSDSSTDNDKKSKPLKPMAVRPMPNTQASATMTCSTSNIKTSLSSSTPNKQAVTVSHSQISSMSHVTTNTGNFATITAAHGNCQTSLSSSNKIQHGSENGLQSSIMANAVITPIVITQHQQQQMTQHQAIQQLQTVSHSSQSHITQQHNNSTAPTPHIINNPQNQNMSEEMELISSVPCSATPQMSNQSSPILNHSISPVTSTANSHLSKLPDNMSTLKSIAQQVIVRAGIEIPLTESNRNIYDTSKIKNSINNNINLTAEAHIPPLLGVAPLGPVPLQKEHQHQFQMMEAAFYHMPHPSDSERMRPYLPRNNCPTPPYYQQVQLPHSDTVEFFQRLSTETLFFIFYYMEGSKGQYLAAKALKKQSWRFHTKYMMWFQRHEEPKIINEEFEQGTYVYFDYEKWGQRKKEGFTFEYKYLEDRDLN